MLRKHSLYRVGDLTQEFAKFFFSGFNSSNVYKSCILRLNTCWYNHPVKFDLDVFYKCHSNTAFLTRSYQYHNSVYEINAADLSTLCLCYQDSTCAVTT